MHAKAVLIEDGNSRSDVQILFNQETDSWKENADSTSRATVTSFGKDGSRLR